MEKLQPPLDGDVSRGPAILAIAISSMVIAFLCVLVRLYIRIYMKKNVWWDDGFLVAGLICSIIGVGFNITMVSYGGGRHQYYLSKEQAAKVLQYNTLFALLNVACVCLVKTSILLFIYRINTSQRIKYYLHVLMVLVVIVGAGTFFFVALQCIPLNALWDKKVEGVCVTRELYGDISIVQGAVYSSLDLFITATPIMILWNVKMKTQVKAGICILFVLGLAATVFNILRVVNFENLAAADFTYDSWGVDFSAQLEQNICIIAASITTFPHLYKTWARKHKTGGDSSKRSYTFPMHVFSRNAPSAKRKKHPYDDITDVSRITVQHEIDQASFHEDRHNTESWAELNHSDGRMYTTATPGSAMLVGKIDS